MKLQSRALLLFSILTLMTSPVWAAGTQVVLETSMGNIVIELDDEKAPITVKNFLSYVDAGFYDGTVFHRVIADFMVQGGGMTPDLERKEAGEPIKNEADNGLTNDRGTVAMARTNDPHSATSQFFINTVDNTFLNHTAKNVQGWGYTVFGKVVEGMDVADAMSKVATSRQKMMRDVPSEAIVIRKASRKATEE